MFSVALCMDKRSVHLGWESLCWVHGVGWSDGGRFLSLPSLLPCISQMKSESGIPQTFISDKYKRETLYITDYAECEHHKEKHEVALCSRKEHHDQRTLLKNMKYWPSGWELVVGIWDFQWIKPPNVAGYASVRTAGLSHNKVAPCIWKLPLSSVLVQCGWCFLARPEGKAAALLAAAEIWWSVQGSRLQGGRCGRHLRKSETTVTKKK